jgi:hypothetical protein
MLLTRDAVSAFNEYEAVIAYEALANDPVIPPVTVNEPVMVTLASELNPSRITNSLAICN